MLQCVWQHHPTTKRHKSEVGPNNCPKRRSSRVQNLTGIFAHQLVQHDLQRRWAGCFRVEAGQHLFFLGGAILRVSSESTATQLASLIPSTDDSSFSYRPSESDSELSNHRLCSMNTMMSTQVQCKCYRSRIYKVGDSSFCMVKNANAYCITYFRKLIYQRHWSW